MCVIEFKYNTVEPKGWIIGDDIVDLINKCKGSGRGDVVKMLSALNFNDIKSKTRLSKDIFLLVYEGDL